MFALTVFSVRYRRSASNVAFFGFLVSVATSLLVGWAQWGKVKPYTATFPYLSLSLTFTGPTRFQNFNLDVAFRLDHLALAALFVVAATGLGCLAWHRAGGRDEQGPVRFHAAMLLCLFGAAGVVVSPDLTELLAFWGIAGVASYLLAAHRWGSRDAGRGAQVALWLPIGGDVSLLLGLALLYSRYGSPLNVERLTPILTTTPGAGLKALTTACLLILAGVVVRAGVTPFQAWNTGMRDAPAAGMAYLQAVWPLLAGLLLYRTLPLFAAAGPQALRVAAYFLLASIAVAAILGLAGNDVRRLVTLAGAASVALLLFSLWQPAAVAGWATGQAAGARAGGVRGWAGVVGMAGLLAAGPGRAALLLAANSLAFQFRSFNLADMGAGWARLPLTTAALVLGGVAVSLAAVPPAFLVPSGRRQLVFVAGLFVVGLVLWRGYVVGAHGPLRRRRAFEPARVREVPVGMWGGAAFTGIVGVAALAACFFTRWLDFLEAGRHALPAVQTIVPWLLPVLAGAALSGLAFSLARARALGLNSRAAAEVHRARSLSLAVMRRFVGQPAPGLVGAIETRGFGGTERSLSLAARRLGGLGLDRIPALPVALGLAVIAVVVLAVVSPGVHR